MIGRLLLCCLLMLAAKSVRAQVLDVAKVEAGIVRVVVSMEIRGFGGGGKAPPVTALMASGSGFVVGPEVVATNAHVIATPAETVGKVVLSVGDPTVGGDRLRPATILWSDPHLDLVLLSVPGLKRPSLPIAVGEPVKGAPLWALGFPMAADEPFMVQIERDLQAKGMKPETFDYKLALRAEMLKHLSLDATVSSGTLERGLAASWTGAAPAFPIVQHRATISQGNSGGPLMDGCGRVVGINTFGIGGKDSSGQNLLANYYYASDSSNLVKGLEAASVRFERASGPCRAATGSVSALPLAAGGLILLALTAMVWRMRSRMVTRSQLLAQPAPAPAPAPAGAAPPLREPPIVGWTLRGNDGKGRPLSIRLSPERLRRLDGNLVIGALATVVDEVVSDDSVSRRHARLTMAGDGLLIEDLNATNRLRINDVPQEPFRPHLLHDGDSIRLGECVLTLERT